MSLRGWVSIAEVAVPVVVFARVLPGAAILFPFAVQGGQLASVSRYWRPLVAFSILEFMVPWGLLSHAEKRLTSSTAGLLMATVPIFVIGIERLAGSARRSSRTPIPRWRWRRARCFCTNPSRPRWLPP